MLNPSNFEGQKVKYDTKVFSKTHSDTRLFSNRNLGLFKSANWAELSEFLKLERIKFKKLSVFDVNKVKSHA